MTNKHAISNWIMAPSVALVFLGTVADFIYWTMTRAPWWVCDLSGLLMCIEGIALCLWGIVRSQRRLRPAQRKNLLEWAIAWSVIFVLLLTVGELSYLSIQEATWWSSAIFVVLLVVELALYYLWGMISMRRIAPRTIITFGCKPLRRLAFWLLHLTQPYASEDEEAFNLIVIEICSVVPVATESQESEVQG